MSSKRMWIKKKVKQVSMKWLQIYEEELVKGETDVRKKKAKLLGIHLGTSLVPGSIGL